MTQLPPLVLALAFVAVGVAAWLLGRLTAAARTVRLPRDYYVGLDHLINDRIDHATEVFARVARADSDVAEIQFALGSLFRRRGEVDRAIAIHTRLAETGAADSRDRARLALAFDYLSAGLMDRAERLFQQLTASPEHRRVALDQLVRLYEQQGDWTNALRVFHELPPDLQVERRPIAAHYLCELAEHALDQSDVERARALLGEARGQDARSPRAAMLRARIMESSGDPRAAFDLYLEALEASPGLALEIIPRARHIGAQLRDDDISGQIAERLRRTGKVSSRQLAWLLVSALPDLDAQHIAGLSGELPSGAGAPSLGVVLTRIGDAGGRYQCDECGLHSVGWYWRCPKCRSWESMHPAVFKWAERAQDLPALRK